MPFLKRLGFYLAGLSIGLIFLAFFLKKKSDETGVSFCYLPNCRVLKDLRSKPHHYASNLSDRIQNTELDTTGISQVFLDGEINFKKSESRREPCGYYILEGILNEREVEISLSSCEDQITVEEIILQ